MNQLGTVLSSSAPLVPLEVALLRYQKTAGDIVLRASSHDIPCSFLALLVVPRQLERDYSGR